jgi:hypothetical protein
MNKYLGSVIIAAALIVAVVILGASYTYKYRAQDTVTVTGLGETDFTSDLIVWRGYISTESYDVETGYSTLEASKRKVLEFITSRAIPSEAVDFGFVNVNKEYEGIYSSDGRYTGQRFTGYSLRQEFVVESADLDAVEAVLREISSLIAEGVQMDLMEPAYYYSRLDDLKLDVIERATDDARQRAERIAGQAGSKIGKLKNARTGVFQITGNNTDEELTAGGNFNTASRNKKARITVRLEYRVK